MTYDQAITAWSALSKIRRRLFIAIVLAILSALAACSSDTCVDVVMEPVHLRVPRQHLTSTTPRKSDSGNFIFSFDSTIPGVECTVGCKELFVNVSYKNTTPEQAWKNLAPVPTGRVTDKYRIYLSRFDQGSSSPLREILVPSDAVHPEEEFYSCDPDGRAPNPLCNITIKAKNGLVAQFWIPRKVLQRAPDAASFIKESLDQFSENHKKGICK